MLSALCTDGVVVEPAAVIQGLWAELWAGAEEKERLQSELQDGLRRPLKPVQPWGSCSMSLFGPFSPSLVLKPHFLPPGHISHSQDISTSHPGAQGIPQAPGPSASSLSAP